MSKNQKGEEMTDESHVISIQVASGQEIIGMIRQSIESQFLTVLSACFIIRQPGKIIAISTFKHDEFLSKDVTVNTSGAFIVELHPDSKLLKLWNQANSNIVLAQPKIHLSAMRAN